VLKARFKDFHTLIVLLGSTLQGQLFLLFLGFLSLNLRVSRARWLRSSPFLAIAPLFCITLQMVEVALIIILLNLCVDVINKCLLLCCALLRLAYLFI
jgi:hypothetical protein